MGLILKSSKHQDYVLIIDEGIAKLEIGGNAKHLDLPYLNIEYVPAHTKGRLYSGYRVTGLIFGLENKSVSTNKLLKMLDELGFKLSSNTLREGITTECDDISGAA